MTQHKLPSVWFIGLDKEKKTEFEGALRHSTVALSALYNILEAYLDECEFKEVSEKTFETPEWAYKQAYYAGQKSQLRKIMYLIEGVARPNG